MSLTLDSATEQRIQEEAYLRNFTEPALFINRAIDALKENEAWTGEEKADLDQRLNDGMAQIKRGEGIPGEQILVRLAELRAARQG